jgi:DNA-binding transcriptional LysR family regulator
VRKAQPHLVVQIYELTGLEIERRLLNGSLDIGISYLPPRQPGLHGVMLYEDELTLVIPADHPLRIQEGLHAPGGRVADAAAGRRVSDPADLAGATGQPGATPAGTGGAEQHGGDSRQPAAHALATVLPGRSRRTRQQACCGNPERARVPLKVGLVSRCAAPAGVDGIAAHLAGRSDAMAPRWMLA